MSTIPVTHTIKKILDERQKLIDDFRKTRISVEAFNANVGELAKELIFHISVLVAQCEQSANEDNPGAHLDDEQHLHDPYLASADKVDVATEATPAAKKSHFGPYKSEYEKGQERKQQAEAERQKILSETPLRADDILYIAREHILQRATLRDCPDGERSMAATVDAFNAIYNTGLTETQGWQFMVLLKMVRGNQGQFHRDDYEDQTGYSALAGEAAAKANQ